MENLYEKTAEAEMLIWRRDMLRRPGILTRASKGVQNKINEKIPEKVHAAITTAVKAMVKTVLTGSSVFQFSRPQEDLFLKQREHLFEDVTKKYRQMAVVEGVGTGAAGLLVGMADFPLFLTIKMKYLFEVAVVYGYSPKRLSERIFLLFVFQMAFSSYEKRQELMPIIENWDAHAEEYDEIEWESFQQEYRDAIDLAKMFQLVPLIGAAVGGVANYRLMNHLSECAKNCYRLRYFKQDEG